MVKHFGVCARPGQKLVKSECSYEGMLKDDSMKAEHKYFGTVITPVPHIMIHRQNFKFLSY